MNFIIWGSEIPCLSLRRVSSVSYTHLDVYKRQVVAGAVILPRDCQILWLNDSKQLSAKKREELYEVILEQAVAVGIGYASPARIDEINILQATYEACLLYTSRHTVDN